MYVEVMGCQSLEMDETFLSKLWMKVATWMIVKNEEKKVKFLDGCNIQIMDEKWKPWQTHIGTQLVPYV